jgi:CheY-like chemotaxis protein
VKNLECGKGIAILIAEDDDGHAELISQEFRDIGLSNCLRRFADGRELLDFLFGEEFEKLKKEKVDFLILLDIKMPRLDGIETLRRIKADPELRNLPVIMLTTTDDPREVAECYRLGCGAYITKPVDFARFTEKLKRLGLFIQIIKV